LDLLYYGRSADSHDAIAMARSNINTLLKVLPLYDVEEISNTRYMLSGFSMHRFILSDGAHCRIDSFKVLIRGNSFPDKISKSHWDNHIVDDGFSRRWLRSNVVMSYISYPETNAVNYTLFCETKGKAVYELPTHTYNPLATSVASNNYRPLPGAAFDLNKGVNNINITIPWNFARYTGYPTNFKKMIRGKHYNVYHFTHVDNLKLLNQFYPDDLFAYYINRWEKYIRQWPEMPLYRGLEHKHF
jgi:hypothetical protein